LAAAAQQRAVQSVGSGSAAAGSAGRWQRQHSHSCSVGPALCRAFGSDSAGCWQRQHSSAAAEQGVGSGSAAAGSAERWKRQRSSGQCRALAAAAQPQLQCRACVVQGLWQQQRRALAAAAQLGSSRAGRWQRQRSSGQCRALEAAAQQRAVQGIGSGGSAAAVQGGSAGCWQRQHSRSCSAGPALCRAFVSGSAGSWQRQHNWASQRRQSSSNSTSALGPKRADVDGESIL
jgi:hypothetical protein